MGSTSQWDLERSAWLILSQCGLYPHMGRTTKRQQADQLLQQKRSQHPGGLGGQQHTENTSNNVLPYVVDIF